MPDRPTSLTLLPASDARNVLREEIVGAHEVYGRCVTHNDAIPILPGLDDRLARLLAWAQSGELYSARDQTPRDRDGEIISVQDWLATIGETQPLAQKRGRDGPNVSKETLVKTVKRNPLVEHRAWRSDRTQGRQGSAALPSEPGLTAEANTAAPHQTFEGVRTYTPLAQQRESGKLEESLVKTVMSYPLVEQHRARRSSDDDVGTLLAKRLAAAEERNTIC